MFPILKCFRTFRSGLKATNRISANKSTSTSCWPRSGPKTSIASSAAIPATSSWRRADSSNWCSNSGRPRPAARVRLPSIGARSNMRTISFRTKQVTCSIADCRTLTPPTGRSTTATGTATGAANPKSAASARRPRRHLAAPLSTNPLAASMQRHLTAARRKRSCGTRRWWNSSAWNPKWLTWGSSWWTRLHLRPRTQVAPLSTHPLRFIYGIETKRVERRWIERKKFSSFQCEFWNILKFEVDASDALLLVRPIDRQNDQCANKFKEKKILCSWTNFICRRFSFVSLFIPFSWDLIRKFEFFPLRLFIYFPGGAVSVCRKINSFGNFVN